MKNSISKKLNKFRTSPLIMAVATIEVILLICVSTFAWFIYAENNDIHTDVITVQPDSGLQIDFNDPENEDFVNIWNYLNEFEFEPLTSLDGRNLFVPTSGTFNAISTSKIKFREATVNDMNSKYINIDFTLTNNGEADKPVYLDSKSFFKLYNPKTEEEINSKAIRIAFYQNDGSSGRVSSSILSKEWEGEEPTEPPVVEPSEGPGDTQNEFLIYFDTTGSSWDQVWIETDHTATLPGANQRCFQMKKHPTEKNIYYIDLRKLIPSVSESILTFIKFRRDPNSTESSDASVQLPQHTIYSKYLYKFKLKNNQAYCDNFNSGYGMMLEEKPTVFEGTPPNEGGDEPGTGGATQAPTEAPTTPDENDRITVYFYNTVGWERPHAHIWRENGDKDEALTTWPGKAMTQISGDVYYCTFNSKYDSIVFTDGESNGQRTVDIHNVQDGHIYMVGNPTGDKFDVNVENYTGNVDGGTYPVISPGVSVGFQRPYAPVIEINNDSGSSKVVVPAFASSIDDYSFASENELFTIGAGQTISLSMIIWLEGTDPDCTEDVYADTEIDMSLIFATKESGEELYTYRFLDKTKETWVVDTIDTDTGVSFDPVIQLYDVDNKKGYMMSSHKVGDEKKASVWQCKAPASLIDSEHIIFRRVNPLKEEEVWNYWDTDGFNNTDALVEETDGNGNKSKVVYFTAFSDGAPTFVKNSGAPAKSCGGLWGKHEVQLLTVSDSTNDGYLNNYNGQLTINYTYKGQTIEYKASGPSKDFYYFVIPDVVMDKDNGQRPNITFKRYFNVDYDHAINSQEYQKNITYDYSWSASKCLGHYYAFNQTQGGSFNNYWGDDIIYIQCESKMNSQLDDNLWQVQFSTSGNSHKYVYIKKNSEIANDFYTYPCVVPSDKAYTSYKVEQCNSSNPDTRLNCTDKISITSTSTDLVQYSNTATSDKSICKLTNLQHTLYFQVSADGYTDEQTNPYVHAYSSNSSLTAWPGVKMDYVKSVKSDDKEYHKYKADVNVTDYNKVKFNLPTIYLQPNGNWSGANAYFAARFYNDGSNGEYWVRAVDNGDGTYAVRVPAGFSKVIWVRMNPSSSSLNWNGKWNQSGDLTVPAQTSDKNLFVVPGNEWDGFGDSNWTNKNARIESSEITVGGNSSQNGSIYHGVVNGNTMSVSKLDITESGESITKTIAKEFYPVPEDWP